jgi:hypothetical protein
LPQITAVRDKLVPEYPVFASSDRDGLLRITTGIVDAIAVGDHGPEVVIDWKSDVAPYGSTIETYQSQVLSYLEATDVPRGLIVFATTGEAIEVTT